MHDNTMRTLNSELFTKQFTGNPYSTSTKLAEQNASDLENDVMPKNVVLPTGDDIREMKNWEFKYRTDNPKASNRQVRRALHTQFNIVVFGGQNYKQIK